ncbi:hypothetical protein ACFX2I_008900 [Malus domestica]
MSTGAFYSCCTEEEQCRLKLHQTCAHLPRTRLHPLHRHQITLLSAAPSFDRVLSVICAEARAKASLTIVTNATYTLTSNAFLFQTLLSMTLIGTRSSSTFIRTKKIARVVVFLLRTYASVVSSVTSIVVLHVLNYLLLQGTETSILPSTSPIIRFQTN